MKNIPSNWLSWAMLLLLALIWGSSFILMKLGMFAPDGSVLFSWDQVAALRLTLAGLVLVPVFVKAKKRFSRSDWLWVMGVGLFGNVIPAFLFTLAEMHVDSAFAGVLNSLTPIFVVLLGFGLFKLKIRKLQLVGITLGFMGAVGLILINKLPADVNWLYSILIVLATVCYGLSVNIIHGKLAHVKPLHIAAVALVFAGIPSAVYLLMSDFFEIVSYHDYAVEGVMYIAILGVIGTALALIVFNKLIQRTSGVFATSVTYLIPLVALTWGVLFGEEMGWIHAFFGVVILSGVYTINKEKE